MTEIKQPKNVCARVTLIMLTSVITALPLVNSFAPRQLFSRQTNSYGSTNLYLSSPSSWNNNNKNNLSQKQNDEERILQQRILDQLFCPQTPTSPYTNARPMLEVSFAGIGTLNNNKNDKKRTCLFLTPPDYLTSNNKNQAFPAIALPLSSTTNSNRLSAGRSPPELSLLQLLQSAYQNQPISKSKCLILNSILVNRDNTLFDNVPWATWTIGNHTYDAAGNPIAEQYHFGKRDAYNRFMGKDWPGRSLSMGNLAQKILYLLEGEDDSLNNDLDQDKALQELAIRILELDIQEQIEQLAELQQQLAVLKNAQNADVIKISDLQQQIESNKSKLQTNQETFYTMTHPDEDKPIYQQSPSSIVSKLLNAIIEKSDTATAPYRGAYGFSPLIDSKIQMLQQSVLPYKNPYDLFLEIIQEQLYGNVIGCVLEDTWIYDDNVISLGGACVLQRKRGQKTIKIAGEEVTIYDDDEEEEVEDDTNNKSTDIKGGLVHIIECDVDEMIGLALATGSNIQIPKEYWEDLNIMVKRTKNQDINDPLSNSTLPSFADIEVVDSKQMQIQDDTSQPSNPSPGISIPKTTAGFFSNDSNNMDNNVQEETPVESLSEFDSLTNPQKAQMLSSLESFQQSNAKLPRPRTLQSSPTLLTDLLLPYIDESVRRQYSIRQAKQNNDFDLVQKLQQEKSNRQIAQEMAESSEDETEQMYYSEESEFYKNIRADVTQDEGSYSRFLDKDDWYERDRLRTAKNAKKSDFGTLLDGIE